MDAGEVFLSCNNLTLEQYRTIVLSRALTGAGGCVVSIAVLGIILLTTKRKAWENLTKRVYLANILYTLLYSIAAIAAVNYSHPPSQESAWCEAMGFILQYSGTLVIVHYCAFTLVVVFQVTSPVFAVSQNKKPCDAGRTKLREVFLYLFLFLCPLLNTWEPFLPQIPSYGNYGPLCWFRLELTNNCTYSTFNECFLEAIPNAVVCFGYFVLTSTISLALCGLYCKFRANKSGNRIIRVIPTVVVLTILTLVMMLWFLLSAVSPKGFGIVGSFSAWLKNVTITTATTTGMLVAVGIYVHFPTHLCKQCRRATDLHQQIRPVGQNEGIEQQPAHPPEHNNPPEEHFNNPPPDHMTAPLVPSPPKVNHRNNSRPSHTGYSNPHSPVTTDHETAPLLPKVNHRNNRSSTCYSASHETVTTNVPSIPHPPKVVHQNKPLQTRSTNCHSPVTTDHETAPKVNPYNDRSSTCYSASHETVTTDAVPSIPHPPNVVHHDDPLQTRSTNRHSPVTTDHKTARLIAHPPKVNPHNDRSSTCYNASHETVTTNI